MFWSDRGSEKGGSGFFGSALGVAPISNLGGLGRFFRGSDACVDIEKMSKC